MLMALAGALVLLAAAAAAAALRASASGNPVVSIQPASQVVQPGESVRFDIAVSGVTDVAAWEVRLKYDPQVLAFQSFEETPWMSSTGRQVTCPEAEADEVNGIVVQYCGSIGATPPGPGGDGVLGRFTFSTKATGTSNLEFVKIGFAVPEGSDCCGAFTVEEGAVRIASAGGDAQLPPTPTPNPAKLTPTPVNAQRGDLLLLTPVVGAPVEDAGPPPPSGSPPSGSAPAGTPEESARLGEVAGAASGLFGGTAAPAGRSGAPIAGTGSRTTVASAAAAATTMALGVAGLFCIVASGAERIRGGRQVTARPPRR